MNYLVETSSYGDFLILYKKIGSSFQQVNKLIPNYPIEKEILKVLLEAIRQEPVFLRKGSGDTFSIPDQLGEVVEIVTKLLPLMESFREKLIFLSRIQFFDYMESKDYSTLKDKLSVFLLSKKITTKEGEN